MAHTDLARPAGQHAQCLPNTGVRAITVWFFEFKTQVLRLNPLPAESAPQVYGLVLVFLSMIINRIK